MSNWVPWRRRRGADGELLIPEFAVERPWLRQMYCDPKWMAAVLAMAVAALGILLWFLPAFPNGPRHGGGLRWLSGRHWVHARMAAGAARAATAAGNAAGAAEAWQRAVSNDPECVGCERAHLEALLRESPPLRASLTNGTRHGLWLLRIGGTNPADVALVARLLSHHGEPREAVALMEPSVARFSAAELPVYFAARMAERTFAGVGPLWAAMDPGTRKDPAVHLHELAWRIGWGPAGDAPSARREMAAAAKSGPPGLVARLELELAFAFGAASDADAALARLRGAGLDGPLDHVAVARLWQSAGRPDRARAGLARAPRPRSADEALALTGMALALGERDQAIAWLRDAAPRFDQAELWLRWGSQLVERGDWAMAGDLGKRMRDQSGESEVLRPYAGFLIAMSAEKAGRVPESSAALLDLVRTVRGDPTVLWIVSGLLVRHGHPREAQALLGACEAAWAGKPDYWELACRAATASDDVEGMAKAARHAWELAPGDPSKADRLGAALVALRRDPAEAVRLTMDAVGARPDNHRFRATRAMALIQIGRDDEGLALLAGLETAMRRDPWIRTMVYLGRFEVHSRRGDARAALEDYGGVDSRQLLPPQVMWLEKQFEGINGVFGPESGRNPAKRP